jgi:hypothetical protein
VSGGGEKEWAGMKASYDGLDIYYRLYAYNKKCRVFIQA